MPILSATVFDNTGHPYNVTRILSQDFIFDQDAYQNYSRVFLPATYVLSYALQFAALPALVVHALCWYRKDLWNQWKESLEVAKDGVAKEYRSRGASEAVSPTVSNVSTFSQNSTSPDLDNLLTAEEIENSNDEVVDDVPNIWYILTGLVMTGIGLFVVEG
jgi:OPT oligopeptide transporter protein